MSIQKVRGPHGIWVEFDISDAATPVLVCGRDGSEYSSTYDCAMGSGFIDDVIELDPTMIKWLESLNDRVEETYEIARKDAPEYQ